MINLDQSLIRHPESHRIDTLRGVTSSGHPGEEARMIIAATLPTVPKTSPVEGLVAALTPRYGAPMTTSANSVIAAIEARRPGLSEAKTHLLLFFCQGHHLAHGDNPLFIEAIHATDRGVVVDLDTEDAPSLDAEGPLNTVGSVLSRYSNLSPAELRTLIQASQPWQLAMKSTVSPRIEWSWLRDWFRRDDEVNDPENDRPTVGQLAAWRARRTG